jgi:hypothetical protein
MKLPTELLLLTLSLLPPATPAPVEPPPLTLHPRSASFPSVRGLTSLSRDFSTTEDFAHPTKFFHESTFSQHYDGRFASAELPHHVRLLHLRLMLKAYTDTMERIHIQTWMMHGCLLGWWWNARIMPWDTDIDMLVDETGIQELGGWWNMSVHHFSAPDLAADDAAIREEGPGVALLHEDIIQGGKKYLLEVNPHYANISTRDKKNVIDARWIDTATGLFIDITTLHVQPRDRNAVLSSTEHDDVELFTKDQHAYSSSQMFPLRATTFEGIPVHIPYNYEGILLDEYGPRAITQRGYRGWRFDRGRLEWVLDAEDGTVERRKVMTWLGERDDQDKDSYSRRTIRPCWLDV